MNIDQLIRDADPAADWTVPSHDSPIARRSFERALTRPARRPRRRRARPAIVGASLAATAAAVGIAIGLAGVAPGSSVSPAAAAVLIRAAARASVAKPLLLRPGQYLYTETRSLADGVVVPAKGKAFYPEYVETQQVWQTAAGVGKTIETIDSPVTFQYGTKRNWVADGRPQVWPKSGQSVSWMTAGGSSPAVPLDNLSHLPTKPAVLLSAIEHGATGLADINADVENPSTPGGAFFAAMILLTEPSTGSSPALRSALFEIMATLPGDKLLGPAETRSGQNGIAIRTPPIALNGTDVFKLIVDPSTGNILEYDEYAHPGDPPEQWSELLSTGVVNAIGQIPAP